MPALIRRARSGDGALRSFESLAFVVESVASVVQPRR